MIKDHSDRKPDTATWATLSDQPHGFFYMHHPTDRITHTTAFVTPVVEHWMEREIAQWGTLKSHGFIQIIFLSWPCLRCKIVWRWPWRGGGGTKCSSMVGRPLIVRWIVGGHIELFLVPASVHDWYNKGLWDGAYKITLAANRKV